MARPGPIRRGDRLTARMLNDIRSEGVHRITGIGATITRSGGNVSIAVPGPNPCHAIEAIITAIYDDYLACNMFVPQYADGVPVPQNDIRPVSVAKPFWLRRTPFDGKAWSYDDGSVISYLYANRRARTATKGLDTQEQVLTADYAVGEVIDAISVYTSVPDNSGNMCRYSDLNTASRTWARKRT